MPSLGLELSVIDNSFSFDVLHSLGDSEICINFFLSYLAPLLEWTEDQSYLSEGAYRGFRALSSRLTRTVLLP
jgi:hypothetical protein